MAPSLYPIVTRPISEPPFECAGQGLLYNGHARTPLHELRSLLFPNMRKSSSPLNLSRPKSWWQAQLALYGIQIPKNHLTIAALRAKLEAALQEGLFNHLPPPLQALEDRLNMQFLQENSAARKRKFLQSGGSDEAAMAVEDPLSFLLDNVLSSGCGGNKACVLKKLDSGERAGVHRAAEQLGLVCTSTGAPDGGRWMVVAKEQDAVSREIQRISQATIAVQENQKAAKRQKIEETHSQILARSSSTGKVKIEGHWHIMCDYIEEQWPNRGDLTLSIARKRGGRLVGKFNFGVIRGVLKFKKENADAEMVMEGKKLEYQWRGVEVDTGMILCSNKEQRGWVALRKGGRLEGQFKWLGNSKLSGLKISDRPVEIDEDWDDYGEEAYEEARVGRWH